MERRERHQKGLPVRSYVNDPQRVRGVAVNKLRYPTQTTRELPHSPAEGRGTLTESMETKNAGGSVGEGTVTSRGDMCGRTQIAAER